MEVGNSEAISRKNFLNKVDAIFIAAVLYP
jgi:hypothetical protein